MSFDCQWTSQMVLAKRIQSIGFPLPIWSYFEGAKKEGLVLQNARGCIIFAKSQSKTDKINSMWHIMCNKKIAI